MSNPAQQAGQGQTEQAQIVATIQTLMKELAKCAPHPDKPEHSGPLFLNKSADLQTPGEYDSMLGAIMAESALGSAFSAVAGEATAQAFDSAWKTAEYASSAMQDRQQPNYTLGQKRMIANDFNGRAMRTPAYNAMMKAYLADLPDRINLEKHLAHEVRRLYALRKNAPMAAFGMAA